MGRNENERKHERRKKRQKGTPREGSSRRIPPYLIGKDPPTQVHSSGHSRPKTGRQEARHNVRTYRHTS